MQDSYFERIVRIQKQFIIFIGEEVCTIAEAEARGWIEVHVDERTGNVGYTQLPFASEHRGLFEPTH